MSLTTRPGEHPFMKPPPQQVSLTADEQRWIRWFVTANQRTRWQDWGYYGGISLLILSWLIGCQVLFRWFPAHLEARGLAICLRHPTLHRGIEWLPDSFGLADLLKGPAAFGTIFGLAFGMVALTCYVQQQHARHVSRILSHLLPEKPAA